MKLLKDSTSNSTISPEIKSFGNMILGITGAEGIEGFKGLIPGMVTLDEVLETPVKTSQTDFRMGIIHKENQNLNLKPNAYMVVDTKGMKTKAMTSPRALSALHQTQRTTSCPTDIVMVRDRWRIRRASSPGGTLRTMEEKTLAT